MYGDSLSRQLKLRLHKDGKLKYQVDLPNMTISLPSSLFPAELCTTMRSAPLCTEHQSIAECQILQNVTLSLCDGENGMFVCVCITFCVNLPECCVEICQHVKVFFGVRNYLTFIALEWWTFWTVCLRPGMLYLSNRFI